MKKTYLLLMAAAALILGACTHPTHFELDMPQDENPQKYPKYVNYDAIEVSTVADIPNDYYGEMGVPITFMQKYNPKQFEIIGSSRQLGKKMNECVDKGAVYVQGGVRFYLDEGNNHYKCLWDRIVIKRRSNP